MILVADTSAPVAQWIRASVFGTEGRRFESYPVYHFCFTKISKSRMSDFAEAQCESYPVYHFCFTKISKSRMSDFAEAQCESYPVYHFLFFAQEIVVICFCFKMW